MIYGSVCSGIEAASVAWEPLGWRASFLSEIEPFPRAVLSHRFPHVPLHGDFTTIKAGQYEPVDLLVGGTPCFPNDVLIVTRRGLIPISDVAVGDFVFTHKNRWRQVRAVGSKISKTIRLRGQGQSSGLVTTSEHPFFARQRTQRWFNEQRKYAREFSDPHWRRADEMLDMFWASPASWPPSAPPEIATVGREQAPPTLGPELAWVIGRWIGDGWTRINHRRGYVMICCSYKEESELADRLQKSGLRFSRSNERTTVRFQVANRALARWLHQEFGSGAAGKTMPSWLFGFEHRHALMDGYLSADGHRTANGYSLITVSKCLALGMNLLANSLGLSASRRLVILDRKCVIEGRTVSERPHWQVYIYDQSRSSIEIDGHRWGLVRSIDDDQVSEVFNLEVEGDNSYVADGIVVHNCQSFSIAGLRRGLDDDRGNLTLEFLRLAERLRPRWIAWENVPGILSDKTNALKCLLDGLDALGYIVDIDILDAQFFGLAQRRRRVFICGQHRDDLLQRKTTSSALTIAQCLIETLHAICAGELRRFGSEAAISESQGVSPDGARRRIKLFGIDADDAFQRLLPHLTEALAKSSLVPENLDLDGGGSVQDGMPADQLMDLLRASLFIPTEQSLSAALGEPFDLMKSFTTSTVTRTITPTTIYTCAQASLNIAGFIALLSPSHPCFWSAASSAFAALKEFTYYARRTSSDLFGDLDRVSAWRDFIGEAEELGEFIGNLRVANFDSVFPISESLSWHPAPRREAGKSVAPTIAARTRGGGGLGTDFDCDGGVIVSADPANTLTARDHKGPQPEVDLGTVVFSAKQGSDPSSGLGGSTYTVDRSGMANAVALHDTSPTLCRDIGGPESQDWQHHASVRQDWTVRRLTPVECERLQGFPDDWTNIPFRGTSVGDGHRYRALGNSMAVNVMRWIGHRIEMVDVLCRKDRT